MLYPRHQLPVLLRSFLREAAKRLRKTGWNIRLPPQKLLILKLENNVPLRVQSMMSIGFERQYLLFMDFSTNRTVPP